MSDSALKLVFLIDLGKCLRIPPTSFFATNIYFHKPFFIPKKIPTFAAAKTKGELSVKSL